MADYLYQRPNSPNWWFEMTIPEDVRERLGLKKRVRRTTGTDSRKKALRLANVWADDLWSQIENARSPDWEYHNIKEAVLQHRRDGLADDEIDDIAFYALNDEPEKYDAYERATNKTVVLKDHLEGFFQWCVDKGNSSMTVDAKRSHVGQFCDRFERLERVTEYEIKRWASERAVKAATQYAMKANVRDFYKYLGDKVLFKTLDRSILDGLHTKAVKSEHKEVISGELFKQALSAARHKEGLMLMGYTGRRAVAISNLTCDDVVTSDGVRCFRIRIDKKLRPEKHKPHLIPIHSKIVGLVDRLISDSTDGYLLPLAGETIEGRSVALQRQIKKAGPLTSHQFRTSIITMLHNSPKQLPDKTIYSVVGHGLKGDEHMRSYMRGLKPSTLVDTVEAIDWDGWEF